MNFMDLYINTTNGDYIEIALKKSEKILSIKKIKAKRKQAEKLLPLIDNLLKNNNIKLSAIKKIQVENQGGSWTALRIGVVTANALGYALGVPVEGTWKIENKKQETKNSFSVVNPIYSK